MPFPIRPIQGLGAIACTAALAGMVALTISDFGRAEEPTPTEATAPAQQPEPAKPQPAAPGEYVPPTVPESEWRIGNLSVLELMEGALAARERNDLAYLARCMESTADKPALDELDTLAAHRQFKWRSTDAGWSKITASWQERSYEVVEDGDSAELVMQVGGSLGEMRLRFVRRGNAWYFAGI